MAKAIVTLTLDFELIERMRRRIKRGDMSSFVNSVIIRHFDVEDKAKTVILTDEDLAKAGLTREEYDILERAEEIQKRHGNNC